MFWGGIKKYSLNQVEHGGSCAQFQPGGDVEGVGVTNYEVQAAIFSQIGVWFIPRVHNRSPRRGVQPNEAFHMVRALRDLKSGRFACLPQPHLPGAADDLARDQERD